MSRDEDGDMHAEVPTSYGREKRKIHIDKTIHISDLISTGMIVIALFGWGSTVETRFTSSIERQSNLEKTFAAEKSMRDAQRAEDRMATDRILGDLQQQIRTMDFRMSDRLEKIADKVGARK